MAIVLYLIRHGHRADQLPDYVGGPNPPLSPLGLEQARYVGEAAHRFRFDVLYSSTMHRALQTARPIYEALQIPWHAWPALGETAMRTWSRIQELEATGTDGATALAAKMEARGVTYIPDSAPPDEALQEAYPGIQYTQPFEWSDTWGAQPLCLEGQEAAYQRGEQVVEALLSRHSGTDVRIAVVGHGNFGSVMMSVLTSSAPTPFSRFTQFNGAISRVDISDDGKTSLRFLNYVGHLPAEMVRDEL